MKKMNAWKTLTWGLAASLLSSAGLASMKEFVADGTEIKVDSKGFSITPLAGWRVVQGDATASLIIESKALKNGYKPIVQIHTFDEPVFIDERTAQHFQEWFVNQLNENTSGISDLVARDYQTSTTASGLKTLLFFLEFKANNQAMMQANLLLSSEEKHYILTYTDLAERFTGDQAKDGEGYAAAWQIMSSMRLYTGENGTRFDLVKRWGIYLAIGLGLMAVFFGIRRWRAGTIIRGFENDEGEKSADEELEEDGTAEAEVWKEAKSDLDGKEFDDKQESA